MLKNSRVRNNKESNLWNYRQGFTYLTINITFLSTKPRHHIYLSLRACAGVSTSFPHSFLIWLQLNRLYHLSCRSYNFTGSVTCKEYSSRNSFSMMILKKGNQQDTVNIFKWLLYQIFVLNTEGLSITLEQSTEAVTVSEILRWVIFYHHLFCWQHAGKNCLYNFNFP